MQHANYKSNMEKKSIGHMLSSMSPILSFVTFVEIGQRRPKLDFHNGLFGDRTKTKCMYCIILFHTEP